MFTKLKTRAKDVSTLNFLCTRAEEIALQDNQQNPGAEHLLLAALDLPDGTASAAFDKIGADPTRFKSAIRDQYTAALADIGIDIPTAGPETSTPQKPSGIYNAAASGQEVMQQLAKDRANHAPLIGAHVVSIIARQQAGVAHRALQQMGIDAEQLANAADALSV